MKLTAPASVILFATLSVFLSHKPFSHNSIQSAQDYSAKVNIQPEEIVIFSNNFQWGTGNILNKAGITDHKNNYLTFLNAGGNILFSTTLSKASVELPSLATAVYFVRVKNKVSGEATNLRFVKI